MGNMIVESKFDKFRCAYSEEGEEAKVTKFDDRECKGELTIPQYVTAWGKSLKITSIGRGAFFCYHALIAVHIPEGVTSIGDHAFSGCRNLTAVTIPQGVTNIGMMAFNGCKSVVRITIPQSVKNIGKYAFETENPFRTLIGGISTDFGGSCIRSSLADVYCYAEEVPSAVDAFGFIDLSCVTLHVPESAIEAYKNTEPWCRFGTIVAIK